MEQKIEGVICLCGNDGTGKSTLTRLIHENFPEYAVIERSSKHHSPYLESLKQQIKKLDLLTYRYAFEKERNDFWPSETIKIEGDQELPVHWIILDLSPQKIFQRIRNRDQMGIYESKKCVEYFSYVYLQLAAFYGMTVVNVSPAPQCIARSIVDMIKSGGTRQIRQLNLKGLGLNKIADWDISRQLAIDLSQQEIQDIIKQNFEGELKQDLCSKQFYYPQLEYLLHQEGKLNFQLAKTIATKWITQHFSPRTHKDGELYLSFKTGRREKVIKLQSPSFKHCIEGESKMIYQIASKVKGVEQYFKDKVWIILKSTIYSHTKQHTGEIEHLGEIRGTGSNLFLQMLRRNNLQHAYIAVNSQGIIYSRKVETNGLEIIFKKQFIGTDKHSYNGFEKDDKLVSEKGKLKCGIYVRFDWRNPNHILKSDPHYMLNLNPYYYTIEKYLGKQVFFQKFIRKQHIQPIGDKCISEDLVKNYVDTSSIKKAALSLYCSFAYYCRRVNLQIVDGCFMFDKTGSIVWSEINPDCMRVKRIETGQAREDYDKDIWRAGGSSSKSAITEKWKLFNKILIDYFTKNRFHETQLLQLTPLSYTMNQQALRLLNSNEITLSQQYKSYFGSIAHCTQNRKEVIATIDINDGKPTLVKSSELSEHHSGNSLEDAYSYISVLPKIVLVDLDAAMGKPTNNRQSIKQLRRNGGNNIYGVGGGIRSLQVLNFYLNTLSVPKAIMSSNLQLLNELPREIIEKRIIVELSINEKNEILTHGRTVNTGQDVIKKMIELSKKGVKTFSLTFQHKQGHLAGIPRNQLRDIMFCIPGAVEKVIIAGGITSMDDLEFIWGFPKTVPQLGSAIWKNKISVVELLCKIVKFGHHGICPAIITSESGKVLGEVFLNEEALRLTAQTRELYRYSRQLQRLIKKGEQSGNTQKVIGIRLDCDNDCLNIIVEESSKPFCHLFSKSCFDFQFQNQIESVEALQHHIWTKKDNGSGYSKKMQQNEHFAASKFIQESYEFITTKNRFAEEGADTIAHLLMYLNAKNVSIKTIMAELNFRANKVKALEELVEGNNENKRQFQYIAIMGSKYYDRLDKTALNLLGLKIIRAKNRSLQVEMTVEDKAKYDQFFQKSKLKPIVIKSKDMSLLLAKKEVKWCFNYSIMMQNYPKIWKELIREIIPTIKLVVLKKKDKIIDPFSWTKQKKGKVVSQYPLSMINYLDGIGVDEANYTLFKVSGGTEGYLQCQNFDYCDAIVETGRTLEDNNLQIVSVICSQIFGALYVLE